MHLRLEQYTVLVEFRGVENSIQNVDDPSEPLVRTFDLVLIYVPHLASVRGEVVRERSFMAKFRGEVDSGIFEIDKEQGLIRMPDFNMVH